MAQSEHHDDIRLVKRALKKDQDACRFIFAQYHRLVYFICRNKLDDSSMIEDAVQETFFFAFRDLGDLRNRSRFKEWLCRIAANQAMTINIKRKKRINTESEYFSFRDSPSNTERSIDERFDRKARLMKAIEGCRNEKMRKVAEMFFLKNMRREEISAMLDIPGPTVQTCLLRFRKKNAAKFKDILDDG